MNRLVVDTYAVLTGRKQSSRRPDEPGRVEDCILRSVIAGEALVLVGFWGVGDRRIANGIDTQALDKLSRLRDQIPIKTGLTLILAREHGRLNGRDCRIIDEYHSGIRETAEKRGLLTISQSDLWAKWGLREPFGMMSDDLWDQNPLAGTLEDRSRKHYRGPLSPRQDAMRYYSMCLTERGFLSGEFPRAIWWTYSSPEFVRLLPDLPRVYLWSIRKGITAPPWFM